MGKRTGKSQASQMDSFKKAEGRRERQKQFREGPCTKNNTLPTTIAALEGRWASLHPGYEWLLFAHVSRTKISSGYLIFCSDK
jgi:hypothetical protein